MTVTFCGHAEIAQSDNVRNWLISTVGTLIADGADTFYLGGYGAFDNLAAAVLQELKKGQSAYSDRLGAGLSEQEHRHIGLRFHALPRIGESAAALCHFPPKRAHGGYLRCGGGLCNPWLGRCSKNLGIRKAKKKNDTLFSDGKAPIKNWYFAAHPFHLYKK